jgi:tetratricopeptide (TPR) repeat protein
LVLQRQNQLDRAEEMAAQALQQHPRHHDLWVAQGQTQLQLGQLAEAKTSFNAALAIEPGSSVAHFAAANVCQRLGDEPAAQEHRRQMKLAQTAKRRDELPFEQQYKRSLRSAVATVLSSAATEHDTHGEAAEAERLFRRACEISPDSPEPHRHLAALYHRDRKPQQGLVVQQRLMQIEPDNLANYLNFASVAEQIGQTSFAEATLEETASAQPENAAVRQALVLLYFRSERWDRARPLADELIRLAPSLENYQVLARICRRQGDLAAAAAADSAAARLQPAGPQQSMPDP